MVDVVTDAEREVHLLWLEPVDLSSQDVDLGAGRRHGACRAAPASPCVAAVDGVRQVEVDHRRLGEVREALVLETAQRRDRRRRRPPRPAPRSGSRPAVARRRSGAGRPSAGCECSRADTTTSAARTAGRRRPRRPASPRGGPPRRPTAEPRRIIFDGEVVGDVDAVEGLRRRPDRLAPEPERLALVGREVAGHAGARIDGQDRRRSGRARAVSRSGRRTRARHRRDAAQRRRGSCR